MAGVIREFIDKKKGGTEPTDLGLYILDIMDAEFTMTVMHPPSLYLNANSLCGPSVGLGLERGSPPS
jgi:hypothetical protein